MAEKAPRALSSEELAIKEEMARRDRIAAMEEGQEILGLKPVSPEYEEAKKKAIE